ncbi:MAG: HD domain-containing protein [Solirubrobacteraceae bacterium]
MRDEVLLDELGRPGIERAIADAVEGEEDGWCGYLDAEFSENEDDPDCAAEELLRWRVCELRKAGTFLVALVEAEFQLTHPTEDYSCRTCGLDLALVLERDGSGWSVSVCERVFTGQLGDQLAAALLYSVEHHGGQTRKGTAIPYVSHVLAVAALAMEMAPRAPAEAIGALLHDVVEDSGGMDRANEIAQRFGLDVLRIVLANSDTAADPKPPWRQRKEDYLAAMADKEPDELRVSLADKMHNARAILRDLHSGGDVWARFNARPDEVCWYYRRLADGFLARPDALGAAGVTVAEEFDDVVSAIDDIAQSRS